MGKDRKMMRTKIEAIRKKIKQFRPQKPWKKGMEWAVLCSLLACFLLQNLQLAQDCEALRENTLRLHILANSDSPEDQLVKLAVRDRILEESKQLFLPFNAENLAKEAPHTKEELLALAEDALEQIRLTAQQELAEQGIAQPVSAKLTSLYFEERQYGEYVLPEGIYDAVQVEIGAGEGKNWWCVLFPPLCVSAAMEQTRQDPLLQEDLERLERVSVQYVPRIAFMEWLKSFQGGGKKAAE